METLKFSRRSFVLSGVALAGCQTTGMTSNTDKVLTSEYDGNYTIIVNRLWNPTPNNLRDPYYRKEPETLAYLTLKVEGGSFEILRVDDSSKGANYRDFSAAFYEGGLLEIRTTVGYLVGVVSPFKLRVSANIGVQLLSGQTVTLQPRGYDANYSAHLSIQKTS